MTSYFFVGSFCPVPIPSLRAFSRNYRKYRHLFSNLREKRSFWFFGIFAEFRIENVYSTFSSIKHYSLRGVLPIEEHLNILSRNAHVLRGDVKRKNHLTIVKGGKGSRLFPYVIPISRRREELKTIARIFHKRNILKRNNAKWWEVILNNKGTAKLKRYVNSHLKRYYALKCLKMR